MLVTGASGFLGRATATAFERKGWAVVRGVRRPANSESIRLDIADAASVASIANLEGLDGVVHLAAKCDFNALSVGELFVENIAAVAALLSIARSWNAHFVFSSAALVGAAPGTEGARPTEGWPANPYIRSKWFGELLSQESGSRVAILRFGGIFGWNGPTHLGLNKTIAAMADGALPVVIGEGHGRRNYIYVEDAAQQIVHALEKGIVGTHVIAGTEVLTIREMLEAVCDVFLPGQHPNAVPGPETGDQVFPPSDSFPPTRPFRAALTDIKARFA